MKIKLILASVLAVTLAACDNTQPKTVSSSGISRKETKVVTDSEGWSVEQRNIAARLKADNEPGAIKHLYVISPYSGQVILYSTVKGKVTSGGKRLTPNTVEGYYNGGTNNYYYNGMPVDVNDVTYQTAEVLQDDGSYGNSCEYIFWFDQKGEFHQHFFTGGQIIHVSAQPMPVKNVIINVEQK